MAWHQVSVKPLCEWIFVWFWFVSLTQKYHINLDQQSNFSFIQNKFENCFCPICFMWDEPWCGGIMMLSSVDRDCRGPLVKPPWTCYYFWQCFKTLTAKCLLYFCWVWPSFLYHECTCYTVNLWKRSWNIFIILCKEEISSYIIKIRQSHDHLTFVIEILDSERWFLYWNVGLKFLTASVSMVDKNAVMASEALDAYKFAVIRIWNI